MKKKRSLVKGILTTVAMAAILVPVGVHVGRNVNMRPRAESVFISPPAVDVKVLQRASCTVKTESGSGSGTFIAGLDQVYVITCAHVVAKAQVSDKVYNDVDVVTLIVEDGREVGSAIFKARVVAASTNYDCALLVIRSKAVGAPGVKFAPVGYVPSPGDAITHVGSPLGPDLTASVLTGNISAVGRVVDRQVFDQTTVAAFPGCSGGGVFNSRGEYVGMIARAAGPGLNLLIPIRVVREWADTEDLGFLFR